jgi:DNA-binding MarR family transcriptional regulator|tara:strand:- start:1537 stop:1734 length:198 start_codon:yes stop_codon:yes gene_type:complete
MSVNVFERKDRRGGGYAKRKFTLEEANSIRDEYKAGGISQNKLADKYNVSQPIINMILKNKTYCK